MAKILLTYQASGLNTVRKIVSRWAPPVENNTAAYVADVAQRIGVNPDAPVDLHNAALMAKALKAIVHHENGQQPYADDIVARGVALAQPATRAA